MPEGLTVVTIEPGAAREEWRGLLELADEPGALRHYLQDGVLYGAVDDQTLRPLAAVLVVEIDQHTIEIRAVAVDEAEQGRGLGTWMVAEVCDRLCASSKRIVVGTASSATRQLAFYQRLGFRMTHIERDYFTEERGYPPGLEENEIPTRDMVWMDVEG